MNQFTRLNADVAAVLALTHAQESRIALREDTRLSLYRKTDVPSWMSDYATWRNAVEILVDGTCVGIAFGCEESGWMFTITNQNAVALNAEMALAVDAALEAGATRHCIDRATVDTFNRWGALAKTTSDALSKELFGV